MPRIYDILQRKRKMGMTVSGGKSILIFLMLPVMLLTAILFPEMIPGLEWVTVILFITGMIVILPLLPVVGILSAVNGASGGSEWAMFLASAPFVAMGIATLYWVVDSVVDFFSSGPKFLNVTIVKWSEAKYGAGMAVFRDVRLAIDGKEKKYRILRFGFALAQDVANDLREGTKVFFLASRKNVFAVGLDGGAHYHAKDLCALGSRQCGCLTLVSFLYGGYVVAALATLPFIAAIGFSEWDIMQISGIYCVMCWWFFLGFGKLMIVHEERRRERIRRCIMEAYPDTPEAIFASPREDFLTSTY